MTELNTRTFERRDDPTVTVEFAHLNGTEDRAAAIVAWVVSLGGAAVVAPTDPRFVILNGVTAQVGDYVYLGPNGFAVGDHDEFIATYWDGVDE